MARQTPDTFDSAHCRTPEELRPNGNVSDDVNLETLEPDPSPSNNSKLDEIDLDDAYDRRVVEFKWLVRRYILQLRYGCTSSDCTTLHCWSCKKRLPRTPPRRPNAYTARMQAYALATRPRPYEALCHNPPSVQAKEYRLLEDMDPVIFYVGAESGGDNMGPGKPWEIATYEPSGTIFGRTEYHELDENRLSKLVTSYSVPEADRACDDESVVQQKSQPNGPKNSIWLAFHVALQSKKDFKSLTQCVFDTVALLTFEKSNAPRLGAFGMNKNTPRKNITFYRWPNPNHQQSLLEARGLADEIWANLEIATARFILPSAAIFPSGGFRLLEYLSFTIGRLFTPPPFKQIIEQGIPLHDTEYIPDEVVVRIVSSSFLLLSLAFGVDVKPYPQRYTKWSGGWFTNEPLANEPALRFVYRLVRGVAARRCHLEILNATIMGQNSTKISDSQGHSVSFIKHLLKEFASHQHLYQHSLVKNNQNPEWSLPGAIVDWLRTLILQQWNGETIVNRWSAVGAAMELLNEMYVAEELLGLQFENDPIDISFLPDTLDDQALATSFMKYQQSPNTMHILSFPVLFLKSIVRPFRAINYAKMLEAYRTSGTPLKVARIFDYGNVPLERVSYLRSRLAIANSKTLLLDVRREHALEDAFNQLRGREKRELIKPLKVKVGEDEGEQGIDQGGVTQEFFHIVFQKVFEPDYGMFTTDPATHMSWFRPLSPVALYQWELVGVLLSLAVYNGAIVPVNFPLCLYQRLLTGKEATTIEEIEDGWPDLAKGLRQLRDWDPKDGDVAEVFAREFKFTINSPTGFDHAWLYCGGRTPVEVSAPGTDGYTVHYDMPNGKGGLNETESKDAWRRTYSSGGMVTNENRHIFIKEYIRFLTVTSIESQYEAFARGFYTCLDTVALSILTPKYLQLILQGRQDLDIEGLEEITMYEGGYSPTHRIVEWFWEIVKAWSPDKQRSLLEFVTASDRVPISGIGSIKFIIQKDGSDSDRLPSSHTCYGYLLIPEYESKEQLEKRLSFALECGRGFGTP
ncbi:hypothetical protein NA57DRAFT_76633 [Rhizodiscina lignyota]|uniref:HECT-type E3 ubiquitin transferase n=1 Tax=Rhizodiscina lignyota TaxID=1504668 RepID=A0A9P4M4K6_9PEZI|nr:hypothetical protein NA57DRAFT_76633 [Rhizodiscina lignyota]